MDVRKLVGRGSRLRPLRWGHLALAVVVLATATLLAVGSGDARSAIPISNPRVWLRDSVLASYTLFGGLSGESEHALADGDLPAGETQVVQQDGDEALVHNNRTGAAGLVSPGSGAIVTGNLGPGVVVKGGGATYLVKADDGVVRLVRARGARLEILADRKLEPLADAGVVDSSGRLWVAAKSGSRVVGLRASPDGTDLIDDPAPIGGLPTGGKAVKLTLVADQPVLVIRSTPAKVIALSSGKPSQPVEAPGVTSGSLIGESDDPKHLWAVNPGDGGLVGVSPRQDKAKVPPVRVDLGRTGDLGAPVVAGGRAFVPDYTRNEVVVVDLRSVPPRVETTIPATGGKGRVDIVVKDGLVFVNDATSKDVVVVTGDGEVTTYQKHTDRVRCVADGGTWHRDGCRSDEEMEQLRCEDGGGRWTGGGCKTREEIAEEECEAAGRAWVGGTCVDPPKPPDPVPPPGGGEPGPGPRPEPPPAVPVPPGAAGTFEATPGNGTVLLAWTPAPDNGFPVTRYEISEADGQVPRTVVHQPGPGEAAPTARGMDGTSALIEGLDNGTTYLFRIVAVNEAGPGPVVTGLPVTPSADAPGMPTNVRATPGVNQAEVTFTAPRRNGVTIAGYEVLASSGQRAEGASSPITVTGLAAGDSVTFTVVAKSDRGTAGPPSDPSPAITLPSAPGAPTGFSATGGAGTVALTWSPPADDGGATVTGYQLFRDGTRIATPAASARRYDDAPLPANTSVTYQLRAVNDVGTGQAATATARTFGTPGAPGNLRVTSAAPNALSIAWDTPADGGSPLLRQYVSVNGSRVAVAANAVSHRFDGLAANSAYTLSVSAENAVGEGPAASVGGTTGNNAPTCRDWLGTPGNAGTAWVGLLVDSNTINGRDVDDPAHPYGTLRTRVVSTNFDDGTYGFSYVNDDLSLQPDPSKARGWRYKTQSPRDKGKTLSVVFEVYDPHGGVARCSASLVVS